MHIRRDDIWNYRLSTKNLQFVMTTGSSKKLGPLYCGPFKIMEKLIVTYKLDLPPHMKVQPMFHISQLKLHKKPDDSKRTYNKPNPIITSEGTEEYEVEEVINHQKRRRGKRTKIEYLIF